MPIETDTLTLTEITPPGNPPPGKAQIFLRRDGAGVPEIGFLYPSNVPTYVGDVVFQDMAAARFRYGNAEGLFLYLYQVPGPQNRVALWDPSVPLPSLPHTGSKPAFAVGGDVLIGDIIAIESNPMTYFMRVDTGLPESAVTQLFSARTGVNDTDGGAHIVYAPFTGRPGANDGWIRLIAYGGGDGPVANKIEFYTRSGPNSIARRAYVDNAGIHSGDFVFENGWRLTEAEKFGFGEGIALVNPDGTLVRVLNTSSFWNRLKSFVKGFINGLTGWLSSMMT